MDQSPIGRYRNNGWTIASACTPAFRIGVPGAETPVNLAGPILDTSRGPRLERPSLCLMIQEKLADGRLPNNDIPRIWGGPGNGKICDGCDEIVTKGQMIMEGLSGKDSGVQFHVACFYVWDVERQVLGHEPSGPA